MVIAVVLSVLVVGGAVRVRALGWTSPDLYSTGWSAKNDESTFRVRELVRVGNASGVEVTVAGARVIRSDGQPFAGIVDIVLTPTEIPPGTWVTRPGLDPVTTPVDVPMSFTLVCDQLENRGVDDPGPSLVLTTTGTWPHHETVLRGWDPTGFCAPLHPSS